ncbi:MotA/TolQ/ExbB proton channel family protein [Planctomycetes bacterium K23_9]|uniref:Biopolymer transport protein ExbB n=1 Tax=Stieleria marina TaxID=1930275 RepID=A0A517NU40_9BACT|nr:Biopolymer transport protein ExbB [Planctomycetes bacterium K23_9]
MNCLAMLMVIAGSFIAQADSVDSEGGFFDILLSGGLVGILILLTLFALSVAAAYLVFDQVMSLRRSEVLPDGVAETVRQALLTARVPEADAACRREPSVLSVVLLAGLSELDFGWREVEKAVEDSLAEQSARLMRRIEYLSVIGNIAPMVGLLGTVTGMIFAFQQVATTRGSAGAGDLAEGIYQALVTTVGGLVVAIPSLAAYAICRNRVDALVADVAYQTQHALLPIKRRPANRTRTPGAAQPPELKKPGSQKLGALNPGPQNAGPKKSASKEQKPPRPNPPKPPSA